MKTIDFINDYGLEAIKKHSIHVREEANGLINLQYGILGGMSEESKQYVQECRGLVVAETVMGYQVVARCFDKFYNYGEKHTKGLEDVEMDIGEKFDGTLIKVYWYEKLWYIGTKGAAIAHEPTEFRKDLRGTKEQLTFTQLVYTALGIKTDEEFNTLMSKQKDAFSGLTFMFELTGPDNHVVTPYEKTEIRLLGVRHIDGSYRNISDYPDLNPVKYERTTPRKMYERAQQFNDLSEGFVGLIDGAPVIKIKSAKYVRHHHLSTDTSVDKMIYKAIMAGERDEVLAYQPRLQPIFDRIQGGIDFLFDKAEKALIDNAHLSKGLEFHEAVKTNLLSSIMSNAHKAGVTVKQQFNTLKEENRVNILYRYLQRSGYIQD